LGQQLVPHYHQRSGNGPPNWAKITVTVKTMTISDRKTLLLLSICAFVLLGAVAASAQEVFSDANADYTFTLPDDKWRMTIKPSPTSPNVEYVYGDRTKGHLEIRKLDIGKNELIGELIHGSEESKLQFMRGYVAGKEENFAGKLRGMVYNFEFLKDGRAMSGRFYYLRSGDTAVYSLRFTGQKASLLSIQNQTDSIARTFALK